MITINNITNVYFRQDRDTFIYNKEPDIDFVVKLRAYSVFAVLFIQYHKQRNSDKIKIWSSRGLWRLDAYFKCSKRSIYHWNDNSWLMSRTRKKNKFFEYMVKFVKEPYL